MHDWIENFTSWQFLMDGKIIFSIYQKLSSRLLSDEEKHFKF